MSQMYTASATTDPASLQAFVRDAAPRVPFRHVLMVDPAHFQVRHVINPHMEGMIGAVDQERAYEEWSAIKRTYESLGFPVTVVDGTDDFPDVVFAANQLLPYVDANGEPALVLSHMAKVERQGEVAYLAESLRPLGYELRKDGAAVEGTSTRLASREESHMGRTGFPPDGLRGRSGEIRRSRVPLTLIHEHMFPRRGARRSTRRTRSPIAARSTTNRGRSRAAFPDSRVPPSEAGRLALTDCPTKTLLSNQAIPRRAAGESLGLTVQELPTREFRSRALDLLPRHAAVTRQSAVGGRRSAVGGASQRSRQTACFLSDCRCAADCSYGEELSCARRSAVRDALGAKRRRVAHLARANSMGRRDVPSRYERRLVPGAPRSCFVQEPGDAICPGVAPRRAASSRTEAAARMLASKFSP